jgi:hypothetical protein
MTSLPPWPALNHFHLRIPTVAEPKTEEEEDTKGVATSSFDWGLREKTVMIK